MRIFGSNRAWAAILFSAIFLLTQQYAYADIPNDVSGFAWSSNIGWISMNCANDGSCALSNYKVTVATDGTITGYAWSDNVGWIKFGGLSGFPGGGGNAQVTNNEISGWARACAGTQSGDCSGMTSRTDGWDGWISLNCSNTGHCGTSSYKLVFGSDGWIRPDFKYAWGSDVIGWIDFSQVHTGPPVPVLPAVTLTAKPNRVMKGAATSLTWNSWNTTTCSGNRFSTGNRTAGSASSSPLTADTLFTVTCMDKDGNTARANAVVQVIMDTCTPEEPHCVGKELQWTDEIDGRCIPNFQKCTVTCAANECVGSLSISTNPPIVRQNETTQVVWSATQVTSCTVSGTNGDGGSSWECVGLACENEKKNISSRIHAFTRYTLACKTSTGDVTASASVSVVPIYREK